MQEQHDEVAIEILVLHTGIQFDGLLALSFFKTSPSLFYCHSLSKAYNTLFSLQYLAEYSDGTIFVDNDELAASVFSQPPPSSPASSSSGSTKDHSSSSGNYAALNQVLHFSIFVCSCVSA